MFETLVNWRSRICGLSPFESLASEDQVTVLDDLSNGSLHNLKTVRKKFRLLKVDVSKENSIVEAEKVEGVFHLACHPRP